MRPIVWFAVVLGVSSVIVYVFADRAPVVVGGSETGGDNTALGTLYDVRAEPAGSTATVWHNSSGGRDGPKVASDNAGHAWGGAIKPGWTGPAAASSASARPKPDALVPSETPPAGATMAVQRELHRRGCYSGHIDGDWGPTSRFAAAMFFDASRADVPLDKPDDVLLALSRQPANRGCFEAVGSVSNRMPSPEVHYVAVEVDGAVVDSTTNNMETRHAPRIVDTNGTSIAPDFVEGRRSVGDGNARPRRQASRAVSASRKPHRKSWKRRVYQGINLSGN